MSDVISPGYVTSIFTIDSGDLEAGAEIIEASDVPAGQKVVIVAYEFMADADTDLQFKDTTDVVISPTFYLSARGGIQSHLNANGWWTPGTSSAGVKIFGSDAANVSGVLCWYLRQE